MYIMFDVDQEKVVNYFLQIDSYPLLATVQLKGNIASARKLPSSNHPLSIEWRGPLDSTL